MDLNDIPATMNTKGSTGKNPKSHCIRCGGCCEPFFMEDEFVEQYRVNFQRIVVKEVRVPELEWTKILTLDNKCVFLFPDNTCSIYLNRPKEFRDFGNMEFLQCPIIGPDGIPRSKNESKKVKERNTNPSLWSDEHKKSILNETKKRLDFIKRRQV